MTVPYCDKGRPDGKRLIGSRYLVEKEIAEGTYGKVYLVTDVINGKEMAVKEYSKKIISCDPQLCTFVQTEIHIMKILNHENLVKLVEYLENETHHHIVMELASQGCLESDHDPHRSFPEVKCKKYFRQMVQALQHMHYKGICHRDIQLSNICLDENDNVRICDFGLGQFFGPKTRMVGFRGNSLYALPESLLGNEFRGPEVDTWALGCCLYKLLTGYVPFRGVAQALSGQFLIPLHELDELSSECKDLLCKILCADRHNRYKIDDIINHPWLQ